MGIVRRVIIVMSFWMWTQGKVSDGRGGGVSISGRTED